MSIIGFGKFSKFYWLIIISAAIKLIISIVYDLQYQTFETNKYLYNSSLIKDPVINYHIFIYFIYYYLGLFLLSLIFLLTKYMKRNNKIDYKQPLISSNPITKSNTSSNNSESNSRSFSGTLSSLNVSKETKKVSFLFPNYEVGQIWEPIKILLPIAFIFMLSEMIIFYFDIRNLSNVSFFTLEIFFIYIFLFRENKFKLYKHHILAFALILIFGFGVKFTSALLPQCEYPYTDPDEAWEKIKDTINPLLQPIYEPIFKDAIIKNYKDGQRKCSNAFAIHFVYEFNYKIFMTITIIGYLISSVFHSFSLVKIRNLLSVKYFSPYSIIFFLGIFGLISSIVSLIITSLVPCGTNSSISNICPSMSFEVFIKNETIDNNSQEFIVTNDSITTYYFDSIHSYYYDLKSIINPDSEYKHTKKPAYGYIEIVSCFTILPGLSFFKATFDFFIIKELGVFQTLLPEILHQLFKDTIIFILKLIKGILDGTQIIQFIVISIANIVNFIGFCIYLELIELKFCGFDKDTKNNITLRGLLEIEGGKEEIVDNEIAFGDSIYGINYERESINESQIEKPQKNEKH